MLHTPTALDKACYSVRTFPSMTMANSRPFSPAAISASTYGQPAESTCSGDHTACHTTVTSSHPSPASAAAPPSHSFITLFITLLWRHPPHLHQLLLHPLVGQLVCFVHPPSLLQTVNSVGRYMDHWIRHTLGKHGTGGGGDVLASNISTRRLFSWHCHSQPDTASVPEEQPSQSSTQRSYDIPPQYNHTSIHTPAHTSNASISGK